MLQHAVHLCSPPVFGQAHAGPARRPGFYGYPHMGAQGFSLAVAAPFPQSRDQAGDKVSDLENAQHGLQI